MAKIFLSYSRKDSLVARKLIDAFKEMGHDPWVDWEDIPPAVGWLEQIFRGIEGSDAFFFLVSPDSVSSEVCGVEVSKAAENNKRIIPIKKDNLVNVACSRMIENLDEALWSALFGNKDYRLLCPDLQPK